LKQNYDINGKWTSVESYRGWKHFRISGRRRQADRSLELELMAVCDRSIRFWIKQDDLNRPDSWQRGWH